MGSGVCSRRQRRIFQCLLLLTVVCGMMYGGMMSYEMHTQLKRTEATALKYQQHQESLSAQLQVVYEHRSRLEKSLQKERLDHKKAKEDYLVYKLDTQQSLNKEKQDFNGRFNSLHVQHQMLKNQHDDLKKQYYGLQEQHQVEGDDHNRVLDEHKEHYEKLNQAKEGEITHLKDNVYNLREENKHLRKAHHDIHTQLQDAQVVHENLKASHTQLTLTLDDHKSALAAAQSQVNEYHQMRETLNKAASVRQPEVNPAPPQSQAAAVATEPHIHAAQQDSVLQQPHKEQPAQGEEHQDAEAKLTHSPLSEKEEDREGEAERKRELAEEEMAQRDRRQPGPQAELHQEAHAQVERVKSAYEQQQEQQRLEAQLAKERRQIQLRQGALQLQRDKVLQDREQRLKQEQEREQLHHREADRKEQLLRDEQNRKRNEYENIDNDIVQGEDVQHTDDEEANHKPDTRPGPGPPAVEEELVIAGNPDQQEDTLDDQYQEEVEDEVQEDIAVDNLEQDEVKHQEGPRQVGGHRKEAEHNEEENYEEEEEDVDEDGRDKGTNRRAEM
ncbi:Golgi integral membrane protein 4 [Dissostichus eleginoides]|uniref:Golgi integral membrane protein 4 n=1 Tax=Dissostichus eleginoides TaxID=100907 RepID=A0AAD9CDZ7_DISEL|nr:Golgi integral membrane protein 4 [Dissostichus eleginoides]